MAFHCISDIKKNTNHKLFKERFIWKLLLEHVDVLEDSLDDGVHVPFPVVGQLHRDQHQAEPGTEGCGQTFSWSSNLAMKKFLCVATMWWASPFFFRWETSEPGPRWPNKLLKYLR